MPSAPCEHDGYHVECYRKFTSINSGSDASSSILNSVGLKHNVLRPKTADNSLEMRSRIFPKTCMFCDKAQKRKENLSICETLESQESIKNAAVLLEDEPMMRKILNIDFVAQGVKYHMSCRSAYILKAKRKQEKDNIGNNSGTSPQKDSVALEKIRKYVQENVIWNKRSEKHSSVYERYKRYCDGAEESPMEMFSLKRSLMKTFGNQLNIQTSNCPRESSIWYNRDIAEENVKIAYDYSVDEIEAAKRIALLLRKRILEVKKKIVIAKPTLQDLGEGDVDAPEILLEFFSELFTGNAFSNASPGKCVKIKSACDDAMFIARNGEVRPEKHIALSVAVKSMTGSKKLVQILNRLGNAQS